MVLSLLTKALLSPSAICACFFPDRCYYIIYCVLCAEKYHELPRQYCTHACGTHACGTHTCGTHVIHALTTHDTSCTQ